MPISIDYSTAETVLLDAISVAKSDARLPVEWTSHSRAIFELGSKTWTPAFATLLLAKATDGRVDTMSLKAEKNDPNAYSARGLCHQVLVPAAAKYGFSIRNTGREPLNNQPFFRYDRIDKIERVRKPADREYFLDVAEQANKLTSPEARHALAAFLREALSIAATAKGITVRPDGLTTRGARVAVEDFLRFDAPDRPQRLQAFAAACLDLMFSDVRTRRINDPSRDFPGDVQAFENGSIALAMEVRGKTVTGADIASFSTACGAASVERAVLFVDAPQRPQFKADGIVSDSRTHASQIVVFDSSSNLLSIVMLWARIPLEQAVDTFAKSMLFRLREIEVTNPTLQEWARAVAIAQSR